MRTENSPVEPGPHAIETVRAVFTPSGDIRTVPVTPSFYEDLDTRFDGFRGHALVQRYTFAEPWPTWEMHPHGDELVYLLAGDTDFLLWRDGVEHRVHISSAHDFLVVPRGTWHTARPRTMTSLLFVTPGEGTLNAAQPG